MGHSGGILCGENLGTGILEILPARVSLGILGEEERAERITAVKKSKNPTRAVCQELQRQQFEATRSCVVSRLIWVELVAKACQSSAGKAEAPDVLTGSVERTARRGRLV